VQGFPVGGIWDCLLCVFVTVHEEIWDPLEKQGVQNRYEKSSEAIYVCVKGRGWGGQKSFRSVTPSFRLWGHLRVPESPC
jgi:hypothetical protein